MNSKEKDFWEPVIGLEVHVQLNTKSKIFSPAPNHFGDEPNTNISEVCTGQPGSLPVINKEAVKKAVQFGLAINSEISLLSTFDRKSYFYPDSPRNFQITQFEHPIIIGGKIIADVEGESKEFAVKEAHLEDDAGMLKHFPSFAAIDYNRAGVPLLEIVSQPVIRSSKEAVAYVTTIRSIIQYLNVSDCNMEEGSLRIDANISVRPKGETTLRARAEIKNMNSFSLLEMTIDSEINRQIKIYTSNPHEDYNKLIQPGSYRWNPEKKETVLMRKKESAEDYRYFPEPDLPPLIITREYVASIKKMMPELPNERYKRYIENYNLSKYSASILVIDKKLSDYFEEAYKIHPNAHSLCNWITVEFAGKLKENNETILSVGIPSSHVAKLVKMIDNHTITGKIAKMVADDMIMYPKKDPEEIVKSNPDYMPINDEDVIKAIVDKVVKENPGPVEDYKNGKKKAFAFLVGQVMKLTKGKANPQIVNDLLQKNIKK